MSQPTDGFGNNGTPDPTPGDGVKTEPNSQEVTLGDQPHSPVEQSEWDQLRAQLAAKPHDPTGWTRLVELAENSGDVEKIKQAYDFLLEVYPNTVCV